jgi:oligoribonuclease NrnB/cAMP/cGMP phosphodiesterase (DHH superfamily)
LIWIDHHKSSIESHPDTIIGYRIDGVAACRLAWQWFAHHIDPNRQTKQDFVDRKVSEPLAVRLAGEYDIWDHRGDGDLEFQFGLQSRELSESDWDNLLSVERPTIDELERLISVGHDKDLINPDGTFIPPAVHQLLSIGKTLMDYEKKNNAGVMHRSFLVEWEGLKFLALTTARCNSLTFEAKDVPETGHDALMGFYYNGSKWIVSLYHAQHRKDIDLSQIAVKYGGGGHRGACGFQTDKLPFQK